MEEEIVFENGRISNFQGLVTLTLDRVILHTIVQHSSTSTYMPHFIKIAETFCGRMDKHLRPALLGWLRRVDLKSITVKWWTVKEFWQVTGQMLNYSHWLALLSLPYCYTTTQVCDSNSWKHCSNLWSRRRERSMFLRASWVRRSCSARGHRDQSGRHTGAERGGSVCCLLPVTGWWTATSSYYRQLSPEQSLPTQTWNVPTPHSAGWAEPAWCDSCSTCTYTHTHTHTHTVNWTLQPT